MKFLENGVIYYMDLFDRFYDQQLKLISKCGFQTTAVIGTEFLFAYTVGLEYVQQHPELIIFGVPQEIAHHFFWMAYHAIQSGFEFKHGQRLIEFCQGYPVMVIKNPPGAFNTHLCTSRVFHTRVRYSSPLRSLQLVFPDPSGLFPWDDGYSMPGQAVLGEFTGVTAEVNMDLILSQAESNQP